MAALRINRYDTRCALCRKDEATKTGSHIVSSFLLQSMFSFDGKPKRGREISMRECLNQEGTSIYYGRDVKPEAIEIDHGAPADKPLKSDVAVPLNGELSGKTTEKTTGKTTGNHGEKFTEKFAENT